MSAHAPHLEARLLRSSLTHRRVRSLRCSAPDHHLGHLATQSLATPIGAAPGADLLPVAVMLGDGIGPDVVRATMEVLGRAAEAHGEGLRFDVLPSGLEALRSHGNTLPDETRSALEGYPGWILGPVSHHLYPPDPERHPNPSGWLRTRHQLYANIRPARSFAGVRCLHDDVDLVVVRENTEGFYADRNLLDGNGELRPTEDMVISVRVVTRQACLRVGRRAFELARRRGRGRRVTAAHKANVLKRGDGLFLDCCREVARDFPDVSFGDLHVDALATHLVRQPQAFDVIVTTNMFGDILSDEAAGLVGGLGLAPGLNLGDVHAMAQAVHGSAPDIADTGCANPIAEILSGGMLLEWLAATRARPGLAAAAAAVERAVGAVLREGRRLTPDLGGSDTTAGLAAAVVAAIEA